MIEKHWSVSNIEQSYSEKKIISLLNRNKIKFMREVCFASCRNSRTGNHLRFDFYITDLNILLEYDGKDYHEGENVKDRDAVKDKYARDFGIKLIRISGIDNIAPAIKLLLSISKKRAARKKCNSKDRSQSKEKINIIIEPKKVKTQAEILQCIANSKLSLRL